ncbi:unnamed protein product [Knipowitschia caucasica]
MPKSDTWPGGTGLEVVPGMDSSGSCDSVLSTNSGCSDDSLEYLSAEEKACLMFLEETIDSLDTEDDSGLSNDEAEQTPSPGTVASKQAELTASFNRSTSNSDHKEIQKQSIKTNCEKLPSYLVPTPFVIANTSQSSSVPSAPSKRNFATKPNRSISDKERSQTISPIAEVPPVPLEVNVIIPPKTQESSVKAADVALQRGPLSYDALVYLRKNASEKKTPLCPLVDHTIDAAKEAVSAPSDNRSVQSSNISRFDRFHPEFSQSRTIPPAVPPKPKKKPENSTKMALSSSRSFCVKRTPNPEMVRQEALHKLGLIKETDENAHSSTTAGVHRGLNSAHGRFVKTPTNSQAARSPSFCVTRLLPETKSKGLQCSASFHHSSRHDHSAATHHHHHHHHHHTTSSQHNHANGPNYPVQSEKGPPDTALSKTPKPSSAVGYTAMVVPGMGADRREALRKLGLLKD